MVLSMTGYGKAAGTFEGKKIVVEIRSLNSKSLDLNLRLMPLYREKELDLRAIIGQHLDRGKVEVSVSLENSGDSKNYTINRELAQAYYNDIKAVAEAVGEEPKDLLAIVMRMPEIFTNEKEQLSEAEGLFLDQLVHEACEQLITFRKQEGDQLKRDFEQNIRRINELLEEVPQYETIRIDIVRERMRMSLEKISNTAVDDNRFEQELIFYIEKMDISEEKMRLSNHLNYFVETMEVPLCGKKLGFITQEIGREINTLGSKSYHVEMQKLVVEMKDHLEKIKEQVLNTL
ncbi:MAG: YicC family protein [Candidatus Fluviicola riflensis]|nr:MAG: YicC family protein [Candidatus Fluviicola riflensis]OGS78183.1 MAG: YicC family protein [Candidatus Fluviicola riflensis]OGS85249.1 MAG: YicC family protein [Fluviicola sp. RIFCSPHIGHO2_01_FULL_43_53]OGS87291.1 MAG: YicC family protein [Fluviicola sp. RIFCSPHIGHO2_12_FULL_43_24]